MIEGSKEEILSYAKTQSRNKIVIHKEPIDGFLPVNLGLVVSESISSQLNKPKLSIRANHLIETILESSIEVNSPYGKVLSISNVGILLEPELKVDLVKVMDKFSRDNLLFVQWDGEVDDTSLYLMSRETGMKIDIKNLSHIVL